MAYRILKRLGQGGMGKVFLARDLSLDRCVALKVLSESLEEDPQARKRFLAEARAAAIDHPFIAKVYSIGQQNGKDFIAMEYVEGVTLDSELKEGPLSLDRALQLALEMAEALSALFMLGTGVLKICRQIAFPQR